MQYHSGSTKLLDMTQSQADEILRTDSRTAACWDYFQFADGSVRMAKLIWRFEPGKSVSRTCLGVVDGTASPLCLEVPR